MGKESFDLENFFFKLLLFIKNKYFFSWKLYFVEIRVDVWVGCGLGKICLLVFNFKGVLSKVCLEFILWNVGFKVFRKN